MKFPEECRYTKDHEWVRMQDGLAVVGITEFAQAELGELVFVELPTAGKIVAQKATMCVVESTKAASDVYSPLTGTVVGINEALSTDPGLINSSPYTEGWLVKLSGVSELELNALMSAEQYQKHVER